MPRIPTLETERLLLRPPAADDLDALAALGADPAVMQYIGPGTTHSRAVAEEWLERMLEEGRVGVPGPPGLPGWLAVTHKQTGDWLGLAALKLMAGQHAEAIGIEPTVEMGYRLARPYWGQGYATEAASELVRYGFAELGLQFMTAIADARNSASNRVLGKAGLIYRKTYALDGRTIHFHSATRDEFAARWATSAPRRRRL